MNMRIFCDAINLFSIRLIVAMKWNQFGKRNDRSVQLFIIMARLGSYLPLYLFFFLFFGNEFENASNRSTADSKWNEIE